MILFVLAGLVARLDAAPGDDAITQGQADDLDPQAPLAPVSGDGPGDDLGDGLDDLAVLDAELGPPTAADDADVAAASAPTGAAEAHESWMRRGTSGWGRMDVGVAWRRRATEPMFALPAMRHELWLVATWRR